MRRKGVRANNENRKELCLKVKMEVPFNPAGAPLDLAPEKRSIEKPQAAKAAVLPYSQ